MGITKKNKLMLCLVVALKLFGSTEFCLQQNCSYFKNDQHTWRSVARQQR
jgi:hypothetical protein